MNPAYDGPDGIFTDYIGPDVGHTIINKNFGSLKEAELYQDELYEKYNYVRLIQAPRFTELGEYRWEVN